MITTTVEPSVANLANSEYHRVGSDIYWESLTQYKGTYTDICTKFAGTKLYDYIQSVNFSEALLRFAEACCKMHGKLFGEEIKFYKKRDSEDSTRYYISFFTGQIDSKGKAKSNYFEVARVLMVDDDGEYDVVILDQVAEWLVKTSLEARVIIDDCFLLWSSNLMSALADMANACGYRYNDHGGHYFLSHKYSDDLYKIKAVLQQMHLYLAVKPIICGSEEDIEDLIRVIGKDFADVVINSEKRLFEMCLYILSKEQQWEEFKRLCQSRDAEYTSSYIAKTRYGKYLCDKVSKLMSNASAIEYKVLIDDVFKGIAPDKKSNFKKVLLVRDALQSAIDKFRECQEISPLFEKHYNNTVSKLVETNKTISFISKHVQNEVLAIEF